MDCQLRPEQQVALLVQPRGTTGQCVVKIANPGIMRMRKPGGKSGVAITASVLAASVAIDGVVGKG